MLFADDCLLYREIHSFQDHIELQKDLDRLETWANNWGMKFNAKKCYILSIKPKTFKFYELNNTFLQQVPHSAYLGIQLSSDLTWKTHINSVTKKANSILGLLRRNLQKCPPNCKKIAYLSLVRSTLEYGSTIWDPYHKGEIEQLEIIQRRAARFITGDYKSRETGCVTNMLKQLDLPSLQERRRQLRLASFYKIVEGLVPALPADQYLTPIPGSKRTIKATSFPDFISTNIVERHQTLNTRSYQVKPKNTDQFEYSFFPRTTIDWNQLPEDTVRSKTTQTFKTKIQNNK